MSRSDDERSKELQDYHNQGQSDASEGKCEPPHSADSVVFSDVPYFGHIARMCGEKSSSEKQEDNDAYFDGHNNTTDQKSSGGCFLTTVCTEAAGLPDDCHELTVLRQFRDRYVARQPNGQSIIAEYYSVAPRIVERIRHSHQRAAVLNSVLSDVRRAVSLIERGEHESALGVYSEMFTRLQTQFSE